MIESLIMGINWGDFFLLDFGGVFDLNETYNHYLIGLIFTYVYLNLVEFHGKLVGKYAIPMDPTGRWHFVA